PRQGQTPIFLDLRLTDLPRPFELQIVILRRPLRHQILEKLCQIRALPDLAIELTSSRQLAIHPVPPEKRTPIQPIEQRAKDQGGRRNAVGTGRYYLMANTAFPEVQLLA